MTPADKTDDAFEARLAASWLPAAWNDVVVVVAVSGGADSVALLRAMARLRAPGSDRVVVAHFNHALRGADSDADERFVIDLCQRLGLAWRVGRASHGELDRAPDGLEAAARAARYRYLQEAAEALGGRYVVTAHTADDQAETVLHHILRGTGLAGVAGMPRSRLLTPAVTLLRPMLSIGRAEVEAYLASLAQPCCADGTNRDRDMTRNRIRHDLLPLLKREFNADVAGALGRLSRLAADAQRTIEAQAEDLLGAVLASHDAAQGAFDCRRFGASDRHVVREAFVMFWRRQGWPMQAMGFSEWDSLAAMAIAPDSVGPGSVGPDSVGPDSAAPDNAARGNAAPGNAAPDSVRENSAPENARRQGPAHLADRLPLAVPLRRMFPGGVMVERRGEVLVARRSRP